MRGQVVKKIGVAGLCVALLIPGSAVFAEHREGGDEDGFSAPMDQVPQVPDCPPPQMMPMYPESSGLQGQPCAPAEDRRRDMEKGKKHRRFPPEFLPGQVPPGVGWNNPVDYAAFPPDNEDLDKADAVGLVQALAETGDMMRQSTVPNDPVLTERLGKAYRKLQEHARRDRKIRQRLKDRFVDDDIPVFVNGRPIRFPDVPPQVMKGRTMVPVRALAETLGATVTWDPADNSVTLTGRNGNGNTVKLWVGRNVAEVNGQPVLLDTAPVIVGRRALFPARFVAEALGYTVGWDPTYRIVTVAPQAGMATTTPGAGGTVPDAMYGTSGTTTPTVP